MPDTTKLAAYQAFAGVGRFDVKGWNRVNMEGRKSSGFVSQVPRYLTEPGNARGVPKPLLQLQLHGVGAPPLLE